MSNIWKVRGKHKIVREYDVDQRQTETRLVCRCGFSYKVPNTELNFSTQFMEKHGREANAIAEDIRSDRRLARLINSIGAYKHSPKHSPNRRSA